MQKYQNPAIYVVTAATAMSILSFPHGQSHKDRRLSMHLASPSAPLLPGPWQVRGTRPKAWVMNKVLPSAGCRIVLFGYLDMTSPAVRLRTATVWINAYYLRPTTVYRMYLITCETNDHRCIECLAIAILVAPPSAACPLAPVSDRTRLFFPS